MKTLKYGNMEFQVVLRSDEEEIFMEALKSDIAAARKYHAWRNR